MSLVAKFDDLNRCTAVLTESCENVFLSFVRNQENCRKNWLNTVLDYQKFQCTINKLQEENNKLGFELKQCRNVLSEEIFKRKRAEEERDSLLRQIALIKELVLDSGTFNDETRERLAFLSASVQPQRRDSPNKRLNTIDESSGSILSPSDIDITEDDLDPFISKKSRRRSKRLQSRGSETKKRPSAPPLCEMTPPKKIKGSEISGEADANESLIATTTVTISNDGPKITAVSKIETKPEVKHNQGFMEPAPVTDEYHVPFRYHKQSEPDESDGSVWTENSSPQRNIIPPTPLISTSRTSLNPKRLSLSKLHGREHAFCTKTVIKAEKCISCDKRIKFGKLALKCRDCRTTCHPDCRDGAPTPCTPVLNTPRTDLGYVIGDFAPKLPPFIPALILHCVMEVESRGLDEVGIYRVPGSEREVKDLKAKFLRGKGIPNLSKLETPVLCGCIKDFLRSLKEPLVTFALWKNFVHAAALPDDEESTRMIMTLVRKLPEANKDTLAYLVLHLQMIARTPACKMPASSLAKVLGPTIVGYSSPDPEPQAMLSETTHQAEVMMRLMIIDQEFWSSIVNTENCIVAESFTPLETDRPDYSNSRTLASSGSKSSLTQKARSVLGHTPLGTRDGLLRSRTFKRPQQFFASPMLQ